MAEAMAEAVEEEAEEESKKEAPKFRTSCYACNYDRQYGAGRRQRRKEAEDAGLEFNDGFGTKKSTWGFNFKTTKTYTYQEPDFMRWTAKQVGQWVAKEAGMPNYAACFEDNLVNGRRLVLIDSSALVKMGVQNFEDLQYMAKKVRELVGHKEEVCIYHRDASERRVRPGLEFLERRSVYGSGDKLRYENTNLATLEP